MAQAQAALEPHRNACYGTYRALWSSMLMRPPFLLAPVDGFGEDEGKDESDEGTIVPGSFLATESDALET